MVLDETSDMDALPEELKLHIISFLDLDPPSTFWYQKEPSLALNDEDVQPLKTLSLVSREWRRLTTHSLFRCIRIRLDWQGGITSPPETQSEFARSIANRKHKFKTRLFRGAGYPRDTEYASRQAWQDDAPEKAARWTATLDTTLTNLLTFLLRNNLHPSVETFSITADGELDDGTPDYVREEMHCQIATATFWDVLFRHLEPAQVTLVACPSTLASLLNCSVRMLDAWAFPGMHHQLVTLRRPSLTRHQPVAERRTTGYHRCESVHLRLGPEDPARPALASLLYIRPWTALLVNEGSYLQAYGTYEYYHKTPPGIVYPLAQGFEVPMALESLTYHSIFPFHDYLAAAVHMMSTGIIRALHVKLTPADKDWDAPVRIGKADISDCWGEVEQVYSLMFGGVGGDAAAEDSHLAAHSRVTTFSSGDCGIESLRVLLERSFGRLGWEEGEGVGVWTISEVAAARRTEIQGS